MTEYAPNKARKSIAWCKSTEDGKVVSHGVAWDFSPRFEALCLTAWWSKMVAFLLTSRVLRDQMCTKQGPKVNCVRRVDFQREDRGPPCGLGLLSAS